MGLKCGNLKLSNSGENIFLKILKPYLGIMINNLKKEERRTKASIVNSLTGLKKPENHPTMKN
jgi:hypothetical protein